MGDDPKIIVVDDRPLSPHFTIGEMVRTTHKEYQLPQRGYTQEVLENARRHANDCLEKLRVHTGPLRVASWYRCQGLNKKVGGSLTSDHLFGLATDLIPEKCTVKEAMMKLLADKTINFSQAICEIVGDSKWLHVSSPRFPGTGARQALMSFDSHSYMHWDPNDSRVA